MLVVLFYQLFPICLCGTPARAKRGHFPHQNTFKVVSLFVFSALHHSHKQTTFLKYTGTPNAGQLAQNRAGGNRLFWDYSVANVWRNCGEVKAITLL